MQLVPTDRLSPYVYGTARPLSYNLFSTLAPPCTQNVFSTAYLESPIKVRITNHPRYTGLTLSEETSIDVLNELLRLGCDIEKLNSHDLRPLHLAVLFCHVGRSSSWLYFRLPAHTCLTEHVLVLLAAGADPLHPAERNGTPIDLCLSMLRSSSRSTELLHILWHLYAAAGQPMTTLPPAASPFVTEDHHESFCSCSSQVREKIL